ncbi:hypothetical protein C0992_002192 [Termitomyces sp. T32_za158]|nr:hypothetical protein C0992_002192 [Termitomyces sp. T32_za158]
MGLMKKSMTDHKAHINVPKINPTNSTPDATNASQQYSTPSLMDLLNEDNILPADIDIDRLETEWFEAPDPFDLAKTDHANLANLDGNHIVRCNDRWRIAELVRLDSPTLAALIAHLRGDNAVSINIGEQVPKSMALTGSAGRHDN